MNEAPKLNLSKSMAEFEYGKKLTPGGVLGIRRPYNFIEGEYPIYFETGKGGRITDIDGNEYIDYLCAYGPIIIGYAEEEIDNAAIEQIHKGFCFSLTQSIQNKLSEKIKSLVKCAEMSVFLKTGSDATTLATRVARGYTGREKIIRCGYHGWHDWCVEVKGGVLPKAYEDVLEFRYNHLEELEDLLKQHGDNVAGIIMTPVGHPVGGNQVTYPKEGFLEGARALADKYGAVLIFDEIRTGFRSHIGGAQTLFSVTPDLSTFGKAIANGYPIGALVGKAQFMKKIEKEVFVSSTFFPNSIEFAAALKTIEIMERDKIIDVIKQKGEMFNAELVKILARHEVATEASPVPQMPFVTFSKTEDKTYKAKRVDFYTQLIRRKVFLQPFHHGYICYRHTEEDLKYTLNAIDESLSFVDEKKY